MQIAGNAPKIGEALETNRKLSLVKLKRRIVSSPKFFLYIHFLLIFSFVFIISTTPVFSRFFVPISQKNQSRRFEKLNSSSSPFAYRAQFQRGEAYFWDKKRKKATVKLVTEKNYYLQFEPINLKFAPPEIEDNNLRLNNPHGIEIVYTVEEGTIKEKIVLYQQPKKNYLSFKIAYPQLRLIKGENGYHVLELKSGREVFFLPKPFTFDSAGIRGKTTLKVKNQQAIIKIDPDYLKEARYPIIIDPTIKIGVSSFSFPTAETLYRKVWQTSDGKLVAFYQNGNAIVYKVSSDKGQTWSSEITASPSNSFQFSTFLDEKNNIYLTYYDNDVSPNIFFKKLSWNGTGWDEGEEKTVESGGANKSFPSVVKDATGKIWVSYLFDNGVSYNIRARFSTDEGSSWSPEMDIAQTNANGSALLVNWQGKPACFFESFDQAIKWSYFEQTNWTPEETVVAGINFEDHSWGSVAITYDNFIHLVFAKSGGGYLGHTFYNGSEWSTPTVLSSTQGNNYPTLTTDGHFLRCFWSKYEGQNQFKIAYKIYNGNWSEERTFTDPNEDFFDKVYSLSNATWSDHPSFDSSFKLQSGSRFYGNSLENEAKYWLDSSDKKISFKFNALGGLVTSLKLPLETTGTPASYRIGIQTDSTGNPSGSFVSYIETVPSSSGWLTFDLPDTTLTAGETYHVIVEHASGTITPGNSIAIPFATPNITAGRDVLVSEDNGTNWISQNGEPTFILEYGNGKSEGQTLFHSVEKKIANPFIKVGEVFTPSETITPSNIYFYLRRQGTPKNNCFFSLIDQSEQILTTGTIATTSSPSTFTWLSAPISDITLTPNTSYRVYIYSTGVDSNNFYSLQSFTCKETNSLHTQLTWGGNTNSLTYSFSQVGFNDLSAEAKSKNWADAPIFQNDQDILYLGLSEKFNYVYFDLYSAASESLNPQWEYWNGSEWTTMTLTSNSFYDFTYSGNVYFDPPLDWVTTTVNGNEAYWLRIVRNNSNPLDPPIANQISAIKRNLYPSAPATANGTFAIVWSEGGFSPANVIANVFTIPTISDLWTPHIFPINSTNKTTITWTTDISCTSQVVYDTTSHPNPLDTYAYETTPTTTYVTSHLINLYNLATNTMYFYRIKCTSTENEPVISPEFKLPPGGAIADTDLCAACHRGHTAPHLIIPPQKKQTPLGFPLQNQP